MISVQVIAFKEKLMSHPIDIGIGNGLHLGVNTTVSFPEVTTIHTLALSLTYGLKVNPFSEFIQP